MTNEPFAPWPAPEPASAIAGPDYVALVIEWADDSDVTREIARVPTRAVIPSLARIVAALAGAVGALVLARWSVRHFRHA